MSLKTNNMSRPSKTTHSIRTGSGDFIHIDLNSHNATRGGKNSMSGGDIVADVQNPNVFKSNVPITTPKLYGQRLRSNNLLLNNLSKHDLKDLQHLMQDVEREASYTRHTAQQVPKATKSRLSEAKKLYPILRNVYSKGSPQSKQNAIMKHILKAPKSPKTPKTPKTPKRYISIEERIKKINSLKK
jgi:hypothetical protein